MKLDRKEILTALETISIAGEGKNMVESGAVQNVVTFGDEVVVDVILTILLAFFIAKVFHLRFDITLVVLFIVGIIVHRVFCVRTTVDKLLFPNLTKRVRFRD